MELSYKQVEILIDDVLRRYKDYIYECGTMEDDQRVAVLETILGDFISNVNAK